MSLNVLVLCGCLGLRVEPFQKVKSWGTSWVDLHLKQVQNQIWKYWEPVFEVWEEKHTHRHMENLCELWTFGANRHTLGLPHVFVF